MHNVLLVGDILDHVDSSTLERIINQAIDPLTDKQLKREDFSFTTYHGKTTFKPKAILALGPGAFQYYTNQTSIDSLRGYVFDNPLAPVVGTYGPDRIRKGKWNLARVVQLDLLKALQLAREGRECFKKDKTYALHPSPAEALRFLDDYRSQEGPLAFDIETPYGGLSKDELMGEGVSTEDDPSYTIERISFSFKPYEAITVPWSPPYIEFAKAILAEAGMKLVWNEAFDVPRLMANGITFGGPICDVMHAWHFLEPSLPMGLKYVSTFLCPDMPAWKLMSREEPEWYSAADSDTLLRCFQHIKTALSKQDRWAQFERHFLSLKILLNKMTLRGITVDQEKRKMEYKKLEEKFRKKVEELQTVVPPEIFPFTPKGGFKKDEEGLRKLGSWEEGRMSLMSFQLSEEEEKKIAEKLAKKEAKEMQKEEKRLMREEKKALRVAAREEKERKKDERRNNRKRSLRGDSPPNGKVEQLEGRW